MMAAGGAKENGSDEVVFSAQEMGGSPPFLGVCRSGNYGHFDADRPGIRTEVAAHILLVNGGNGPGTVERTEVQGYRGSTNKLKLLTILCMRIVMARSQNSV